MKQKVANNPFLKKTVKVTRAEANKMAMDPDINLHQSIDAGTFQLHRARMRNRRGEYQSMDLTEGGEGGFTGRTGSLTAQGQRAQGRGSKMSSTQRHTDINKAENRLRTIE